MSDNARFPAIDAMIANGISLDDAEQLAWNICKMATSGWRLGPDLHDRFVRAWIREVEELAQEKGAEEAATDE